MTVKVEGLEELKASMAELAKRYGVETVRAAQAGGKLVAAEAERSIMAQSAGEWVRRYRESEGGQSVGYDHLASAPGDAPNTDTSRLVNSIKMETTRSEVFVGSTVPYAQWLEFGTSRMAARPWLVPALEAKRRDIERLFREAAKPEGKL